MPLKFLFSEIDARDLNVFRIALGWFSLVWAFVALPNWARDYADDGMLMFTSRIAQGRTAHAFSLIDHTSSWLNVYFWWAAIVVGSVLFIRGRHLRYLAVALWILHSVVYFRNSVNANNEQMMMRMLFFYSIFMPLDAGFRGARLGVAAPAQVWSIRMPQLQLCCTYLLGTYHKLIFDPAWRTGEAMYYVMINPIWAKFPWPEIFAYRFVSPFLTWGSLLLEGGFALLIWTKARRWLLIVMLVFHVIIALVMSHVAFFSLSTAVGLLVFMTYESSGMRRQDRRDAEGQKDRA